MSTAATEHTTSVPLATDIAPLSRPAPHYDRRANAATTFLPTLPLDLIRPGNAVVCEDGPAGWIHATLTHPDHGYPTHIAVRYGRLRRHIVRVPIICVGAITAERVTLMIAKDDLVRQPPYRSDHEIDNALHRVLYGYEALETYPDLLAISYSVRHGVVHLRGNVHSRDRRDKAEQIVWRVEGVAGVHNCLFADDEIVWTVRWAIEQHRQLAVQGLQVDTFLGLVRLQGSVATVAERTLATEVVHQVPGVHTVRNNLLIGSPPPAVPYLLDQQKLREGLRAI